MNSNFTKLIDPITRKPLMAEGAGVAELLWDNGTGRKYEIIDKIPRILASKRNYAQAFGEQWLKWRVTQLDSYTGSSISADRLNRILGKEILATFSGTTPVQVLEAGCGAGRFTEVLLQYPAVRLTSTDLSAAVEANQINFPQNDRHRIIQCDVTQSPFEENSYDVVVCVGVIQHTPNPELTITKLFELVKPGGYLVIDHYTPEIRRYTKLGAMLLRPILKRLSTASRMRSCELLVSLFLPLHKAARHIKFGQTILSRISPITTYYHAYPQLGDELQRQWAILDTHDSLTDWYKHLRTTAQIKATLEELGSTGVEIWRAGNGVEARAKKN